MKNSQRGFIVPLVLIIIAVLAIGGGYYYTHHNSNAVSLDANVDLSSSSTIPIYEKTSATTSVVVGSINKDNLQKNYNSNTSLKTTTVRVSLMAALSAFRPAAEITYSQNGDSYVNVCKDAESSIVENYNERSSDADTGLVAYAKISAIPGFRCVAKKENYAITATITEKDNSQQLYCLDSKGYFAPGNIDSNTYSCVGK